jgi:signal transduction histidine kinase
MRGPGRGGFAFVAQVRLRDGTLATFDARQPEPAEGWPLRLLASLAVLLATVVALSLVAVRWATRPLQSLADAADALGRNIDSPPMAERGPVEVVRAARAFNTMQVRLGAYLRERIRVLAAMSHDLKTPVTRLKLRAELLEDPALRLKFTRDLEELESMVAATLDFLRGTAGTERAQPVDMEALLASVQADLSEMGHAVRIEGRPLQPYTGQPAALKRCLRNLLENAVKYGEAAEVVVDDDAQRLRIEVRDRGPGIAPAELERVFEPFYRLEGSRNRDTGGTGLGLTIARSIAQAHGGELALENRPEGGLVARLTLPRSAE